MNKIIYAVKDLALQAFGNPFFLRAKGEAIRSFQDEVNNKNDKSAIAAHPEDYELHQLGTYNDETGEITTDHQLVSRAVDLIRE